jgi:hypothetical protein
MRTLYGARVVKTEYKQIGIHDHNYRNTHAILLYKTIMMMVSVMVRMMVIW